MKETCIISARNLHLPSSYAYISTASCTMVLQEFCVCFSCKNQFCNTMIRKGFLAMRTDPAVSNMISSDFKEIGFAAKKLADHTIQLGALGFGTYFLDWLTSFSAIYLLVLDRTNWKSNILTSLLIPFIFLSLPSIIFDIFRGEIGKWLALILVIVHIFFPRKLPDWTDLPAALILLIVVAPSLLAESLRGSWIGLVILLVIAVYLLQEHIRAVGGFKNSFTQSHGIYNTVGLILLLVYPVWGLIDYIF